MFQTDIRSRGGLPGGFRGAEERTLRADGRIVFLDIDEVLIGAEYRERLMKEGKSWDELRRFDPDVVKIVNTLLEVSGTQVVLSSSLRVNVGREFVEEYFGSQGVKARFHENWCTPCVDGPIEFHRAREVQAWLDANQYRGAWVAIDDIPDSLPGQHWVAVDGRKGIRKEDIERAKALFEEQERSLSAE